MSKAVMISIQPKWCELIASGKKTIEVRKTAPKLETPFTCYIYCTKDAKKHYYIDEYGDRQVELIPQKVIGEFVCDRVEVIACHKYNNGVGFDYSYYTESKDTLTEETQLTDYDMQKYLGCADDGECVGYGWHISNLVIYDKPKELGEFKRRCKEYGSDDPNCDGCKFFIDGRSYEYDESDCAFAGRPPLTSPPQSWCYVEEV